MLLLAFVLSIQGQQPQLAAAGDTVGVTFGSGRTVFFASSRDGGRSFSTPVHVAETDGPLALGRHRGPRIAFSGSTIAISAIVGGSQHGNLVAWHSRDGGRTWSSAVRINDAPASAREGLHAMTGRGGQLYAAWLDLRAKGTKLYGAWSSDGGASWSRNALVYESPGGTICECCHPSLAIGEDGSIHAMWRNARDGNRDLYAASSRDGGRSWSEARKLGNGTWTLNACPMDGGGLALDQAGKPVTVWRRGKQVFEGQPGTPETPLGEGKDPALAMTGHGAFVAWTGASGLMARTPTQPEPVVLDPSGAYAHLVALGDGSVLAAWESGGNLSFEILK